MTTEQTLQSLLLKPTHTKLLKKDSKGNETLLNELLNIIKKLNLEKKIAKELK
ncbi:hypothetical protein HUE87_04030 [Candidatus Sulfurimonas marisnigri]|uniref:Uncharacterized protein n=1 Tax=Candidatus Sulfurimonas marisnigri TaxID=2740405 RepID=A0A7S7M2W9_9BACT|nr:hypothetical protein [Candidatus Sulfurimonas marisnigri]QOY55414.1 hypothetical protein HUE87_04030 [Candidatus Sulfurimonas marisnigri]